MINKCPICNSNDIKEFHNYPDTEKTIFSINGQIVRNKCDSCQFIFNPHSYTLNENDYSMYYQGTSKYNELCKKFLLEFGQFSRTVLKTYREFLTQGLVISNIDPENVIDIGGGAGEFAYYLSGGMNVALFDYSEQRAKVAREVFHLPEVYTDLKEINKNLMLSYFYSL